MRKVKQIFFNQAGELVRQEAEEKEISDYLNSDNKKEVVKPLHSIMEEEKTDFKKIETELGNKRKEISEFLENNSSISKKDLVRVMFMINELVDLEIEAEKECNQ